MTSYDLDGHQMAQVGEIGNAALLHLRILQCLFMQDRCFYVTCAETHGIRLAPNRNRDVKECAGEHGLGRNGYEAGSI